jgi:hypothetical protein
VVGDGFDMSRRRIEGGESVRVMGWEAGRRMFEKDWQGGYREQQVGALCTRTYDETAEDAIEASGTAHENDKSALPCPVEDRLSVPLLEVSKLGCHVLFEGDESAELGLGV